MIYFENIVKYWAIDDEPLLISYSDKSKDLPSNQLSIAYSIKALTIKRQFDYLITTTTKDIMADVITGKRPMLDLFSNQLFQLQNSFDRDNVLYKQTITEVIDNKLFKKLLPTSDFRLTKLIPNRIDISIPLNYLTKPVLGLREADMSSGIKIMQLTDEELKEIIDKQDPAEAILLTHMYPEMPASEFAKMTHHYDKYGDQPYWTHLQHVAEHVDESQRDLAWLHDTMEDHPTLKYLLEMIAKPELVKKIDIISRKSDETYFEYIDRIKASNDADVIAVKLADLKSNYSTQEDGSSLSKRYQKAIAILEQ